MNVIPLFPNAAPASQTSLTLSEAEVIELAGGYVQAARQLRKLHEMGFTRAYRSTVTGLVVLERAHHDAVVRGQFGAQVAPSQQDPAPARANAAGLAAFFAGKRRK